MSWYFWETILIVTLLLWRNTMIIFTNFYLHRKVSIFLRNDSDCKDVDLYNTRNRYAVIESSDFMRNISWLASCFSKLKKPNKHCSGNQSVIAGVCIMTWFHVCILNSLTAKSVPAGTKLVLFGRYVLNIYIGIVRYILRKTKTWCAKIYLPTQRTNRQISYDIN